MTKFKDLTGQKFGRLTVLKRVENSKHNQIQWLCKCDCGTIKIVLGQHIKSGRTKSCGCYQDEVKRNSHQNLKHGQSKSRLYCVWLNMKRRCYETKNKRYKNYGGKGIKVCEEWLEFQNFYDWAINNGYNSNAKRGECTIDRIDVNGNYEPDNCRWITNKEQANNKTSNHYLTYKGETHTLTEWSKIVNISAGTLRCRLENLNYSIEEAFTKPVINKKAKIKEVIGQ